MPLVVLRYGPYKCYEIIDHRPQKLNGLIRALDKLGYEVQVVQMNRYSRLSIEMFGREIFRCDIRNLMFNMPMEDDTVCQRAVQAVEEANKRINPCVERQKQSTVKIVEEENEAPHVKIAGIDEARKRDGELGRIQLKK